MATLEINHMNAMKQGFCEFVWTSKWQRKDFQHYIHYFYVIKACKILEGKGEVNSINATPAKSPAIKDSSPPSSRLFVIHL